MAEVNSNAILLVGIINCLIIIPETNFVQFNLSDLLEQLGEDTVKDILSSFSCPLNPDMVRILCCRNPCLE